MENKSLGQTTSKNNSCNSSCCFFDWQCCKICNSNSGSPGGSPIHSISECPSVDKQCFGQRTMSEKAAVSINTAICGRRLIHGTSCRNSLSPISRFVLSSETIEPNHSSSGQLFGQTEIHSVSSRRIKIYNPPLQDGWLWIFERGTTPTTFGFYLVKHWRIFGEFWRESSTDISLV